MGRKEKLYKDANELDEVKTNQYGMNRDGAIISVFYLENGDININNAMRSDLRLKLTFFSFQLAQKSVRSFRMLIELQRYRQ